LHSISPRSGINFAIEIIKCHSRVSPSLKRIWEFPHLQFCHYLLEFNRKMAHFPKVLDLGENDLLPYFGDALMAYASAGLPAGQRLILKSPSARNLKYFFSFFPESFLLILVRDGRDVACSAMKTTFASPPTFRISKLGTFRHAFKRPLRVFAKSWAEASKETIDFLQSIQGTRWERQTLVIHYEDLVSRSMEKITPILEFLGLDKNLYDVEALSKIAVRGSSFHRDKDGQLLWENIDLQSDELRPIGRWRTWTHRQQQIFLSEAEESLRYWGYIK
jgi:Sulfotransferase family